MTDEANAEDAKGLDEAHEVVISGHLEAEISAMHARGRRTVLGDRIPTRASERG